MNQRPQITQITQKKTEPNRLWVHAIHEFTMQFEYMTRCIVELSDESLQFLLESTRNATPTNCSTFTYQAAQFVIAACETELQVRQQRKEPHE